MFQAYLPAPAFERIPIKSTIFVTDALRANYKVIHFERFLLAAARKNRLAGGIDIGHDPAVGPNPAMGQNPAMGLNPAMGQNPAMGRIRPGARAAWRSSCICPAAFTKLLSWCEALYPYTPKAPSTRSKKCE